MEDFISIEEYISWELLDYLSVRDIYTMIKWGFIYKNKLLLDSFYG